jgi:Mrp family chromosome partitioning ATPase
MGGVKNMTKATAAKMQYIADYESEKYDKVLIRFPRGTKDRITATGATVNGFTVAAVLRALDSTQAPPDPPGE